MISVTNKDNRIITLEAIDAAVQQQLNASCHFAAIFFSAII